MTINIIIIIVIIITGINIVIVIIIIIIIIIFIIIMSIIIITVITITIIMIIMIIIILEIFIIIILNTDDAVEASGALRCTHYDAFRFFHPSAQPLNSVSLLTRDFQEENEQPGTVHIFRIYINF